MLEGLGCEAAFRVVESVDLFLADDGVQVHLSSSDCAPIFVIKFHIKTVQIQCEDCYVRQKLFSLTGPGQLSIKAKSRKPRTMLRVR